MTSLTVVDASLPRPVVTVSQVGGAAIELSWPTTAAGYALESATTMPATLRSPVTNNVVISGDLFTVQVELAGFQRFFRLRK